MTALTAYALAALHHLDPVQSKKVCPASYLSPEHPWDFDAEKNRRAAHRMLVARAEWRHLHPEQLTLLADNGTRPGPKQLFGPPPRPFLRRARSIEANGPQPRSWSWCDAVLHP